MSEEYQKSKTDWLLLAGVGLIILAIILICVFFLRGETTIEGAWTVEKTNSLTCSTNGKTYPYLEYDESQTKTTQINAVFDGDELSAISLTHLLHYADNKSITDSENLNHIAINEKFSEDGLGFDALGLKFSKFSDGLQISLFANADELNGVSAKYFILNEYGTTLGKMQKTYESNGFTCISNS